jgi:hypothetical protein
LKFIQLPDPAVAMQRELSLAAETTLAYAMTAVRAGIEYCLRFGQFLVRSKEFFAKNPEKLVARLL